MAPSSRILCRLSLLSSAERQGQVQADRKFWVLYRTARLSRLFEHSLVMIKTGKRDASGVLENLARAVLLAMAVTCRCFHWQKWSW
jgi:hypothetical protein